MQWSGVEDSARYLEVGLQEAFAGCSLGRRHIGRMIRSVSVRVVLCAAVPATLVHVRVVQSELARV